MTSFISQNNWEQTKQAIVTLCGQVQHETRLQVKIKGTSLLSFKPCKVQWYAKKIVYKIESVIDIGCKPCSSMHESE